MSKPVNGNIEDRVRELMMRALDGEISETQDTELKNLIDSNEPVREEWRRLVQVKEAVSRFELKKPPDQLWEGYMDSVYRRVERGIGWILLSLGAIVLLSYGLWQGVHQLIGDVTVPWYIKGGVLALLTGIAVLAVSVVREKYFVFKDDPYRDVHR